MKFCECPAACHQDDDYLRECIIANHHGHPVANDVLAVRTLQVRGKDYRVCGACAEAYTIPDTMNFDLSEHEIYIIRYLVKEELFENEEAWGPETIRVMRELLEKLPLTPGS